MSNKKSKMSKKNIKKVNIKTFFSLFSGFSGLFSVFPVMIFPVKPGSKSIFFPELSGKIVGIPEAAFFADCHTASGSTCKQFRAFGKPQFQKIFNGASSGYFPEKS